MSDRGKIEHNISITDVISTAGWEKKGNSAYRGSHPVHGSSTGDNTVVDTAENAAYCFRCSSGGGPLLWIALKEGILSSCEEMGQGALRGKDATEACKIANRKYSANIEIGDIDEEKLNVKRNVNELLEKTQELTHGQLKQDPERLERIKQERNLSQETIEETKIGYWTDSVTDTLKSRFEIETLLGSGLFKINCPGCSQDDCNSSFKDIESLEKHTDQEYGKDNLYPVIGGRVTFPYRRFSRVVYFIGRRTKEQEDYWYDEVEDHIQEVNDEILNNEKTSAETLQEAKDTWVSRKCGKYVKICETEYNDHIIWQELKDREELVITEGIYDAISVHQAGYSVASPITTKFNEKDQNKIIQIAEDFDTVHLVFDGDTAGRQGQQDTAEQLTQKGVEPNLVTLKPGEDLDDWTNENGYEIDEILDEGTRFLDTLIEKENQADGRDKTEIRNRIYRTISQWKERETDWIFSRLSGSKRTRRKEWKDLREEIREEKEKERKRRQLPESSEDSDSQEITDKLKVNDQDKVIQINPSQSLVVNQIKETATETFINEVGTVQKTQKFKVYEVQFGEGEDTDTYKLLVEPWRQLNLGEANLPIKRADLKKEKYRESEYFKKKYNEIQEEVEGFSRSYEEWLTGIQGNIYIELQEQIDRRGKSTVQELDNDTILELVREYLQAGWYTDPKLRTIMYPQIIKHDKSQVKPEKVAKYQPHTQMWTNTKVGKSKTAGRVGHKIDDATPAGLLGFADSDGKQKGTIDGLDDPVFIDEFNFGASSRQLNDQLLSLMEEGRFDQKKAGHSVMTRFYGNLCYMANPKDADIPEEMEAIAKTHGNQVKYDKEQFELVNQFEELIQFLGMNIQAMASRFGIVVFDEEMDQAEAYKEVELSDQRFEKLERFVDWVKDTAAKRYNRIERELKDWLEQEYEEEYRSRIRDLADETHNEKVEKFWRNHIYSYRHARGQAARMAVFQRIGDVVKDEYSIEDIRKEAENQWQKVKRINLESLEKMTEATDDEQELSRARSKLDTYSPKYLRLFVKTVIKYHKEGNQIGNRKVVEELKPVYNDLKTELPDDDVQQNSKYWKWSQLRQIVSDRLNEKRLNLEQDFGIELMRFNQEEVFRVSKPERFKTFMDLTIPDDDDDESDAEDTAETEDESNSGESESDDSVSEYGVVESEGSELGIQGNYKPSPSGLQELFMECESNYENQEIPESDLIKYFGREYSVKRQKDLKTSLSNLKNQGWLMEGMLLDEKSWIRVKNH